MKKIDFPRLTAVKGPCYWHDITCEAGLGCDYLLITGKKRPCAPGEGCTVKESGHPKKRRIVLPPKHDSTKLTILREYDKRAAQVRWMEKTSAMWKDIEAAANRYGTERTLENADAFFRAVYGAGLKEFRVTVREVEEC